MTVFRALRRIFPGALLMGVLCVVIMQGVTPVKATAGINQQINFQGRLLNAQGATVADGYYNIEFKIYQDGTGTAAGNPGGTLKWTEDWLNNNSQGVMVKNGYMSVQLGSITSLSSVDWNQDTLWLSINVGNTNTTCTPFTSCAGDGEMVPMKRMASTPYALNAGMLGGKTASDFIQSTTVPQNANIAVQSANAGSVAALIQGAAAQTADIFQVKASGTSTPLLAVSSTGSVTITPTSDASAALTVNSASGNILTASATNIALNQDVVVAANKTITLTGGTTASRPASPTEGMLWFDTDTKQLLTYANGKWQGDRTTSTKIVAASNSSQAEKDAADYVATGTNDQTVINNALTAAAGGKVYLMEGTYTIGNSISVPNNTTLAGSGSGTVITIPNGVNTNFSALRNATTGGSGTGVVIQDLSLDGNASNQSGSVGMAGIDLNGVGGGSGASAHSGAYVTNVVSKNWYFSTSAIACQAGAGICIRNSSNASVTSSSAIGNSQYGIEVLDSSNVAVSTNNAQGNVVGIYLSGSSNVTVSSNTAHENTYHGVYVADGSSNTISGNTLQSNGNGVQILSSSANIISGNTAQNNTTGFYIAFASNNTITGNTAQGNTSRGISVQDGSNNLVSGNSLYDNGSATTNNGIFLSSADSNTITGNAIADTSATTNNYAINIFDTGSDTNYLSNNTLGGGSINNTGTGTVFGGQTDASGNYTIQPAGTIELMGNTNVTGTLSASSGILTPSIDRSTVGTLTIGASTTNTTALTIGNGSATTTIAGKTAVSLDAATATGMVCRNTSTGVLSACDASYLAPTASSFIQNGGSLQPSSSFYISGTGKTDTAFITPAIQAANDASGIRFQNAAGTGTVMTVDTTNSRVAIGTASATTALQVGANDSLTNNLQVKVSQAGGGDSGVEIATPGQSYYVGIDASDGNAFKIGSSTATGSTGTLGVTTVGPTPDSGIYQTVSFMSFTPVSTGIISQVSVYVSNTDSAPNNKGLAGIYNNTFNTRNQPYQLVSAAPEKTLTANSWNTFTLTTPANVSAGVIYWFAYSANGTSTSVNNPVYATGAPANSSAFYNGGYTYSSTLPSTITVGNTAGSAVSYSYNGAFSTTAAGDQFNGSIMRLSGTGQATFRNSTDSTTAFQVQNAAGVSTLALDTTAGKVLVSGTLDTTTATALNIGTAVATGVAIGQTGTTVTVQGSLTSGNAAGTGTFTNNGSTKNTTLALGDLAAGAIGTAANTVDKYTSFTISPTAAGRTYTIPAPTDGAAGRTIYISNINGTSTNTFIIGSTTFNIHSTATLVYDGTSWNFAGMDGGSNNYIQNQTAVAQSAGFNINGNGTVTTLQGNTSVLAPLFDAATAVALNIGTSNASSIAIGKATGTAPVTISASSVTLGIATSPTTLQAATQTTTNAQGSALTMQGATGNGSGNGGNVTVQGGNGGATGALGGTLTLSGGTGTTANGLVILNTSAFQTQTSDANCYAGGALSTTTTNCTIAQTTINNFSSVIVGFANDGQTAFMPSPTGITTAGRVIYVTASGTSKDFTLSVNGGGTGNTIAMRKNTTATMIWNGTAWTAAGASSSTTLQASYDNTLQSAGGAELVVSKTSTTNGFTIRDNSDPAKSVNGTLMSVQTSSAAGLFQVNSNVTEYASDAGAEVYGASTTAFPANTWSAISGSTVARYITAGNYIATGQGSVSVQTSAAANSGVTNVLVNSAGTPTALTANNHYNVSFAARLDSTSATFTTMNVWYSINGSTQSVACNTTPQTVPTSVWTKINCSFTAPSAGITANNAILIQQSDAVAHKFYVDNISVTIAADYSLATDGSVSDNTNFATNWSSYLAGTGGTSVVTRAAYGNDASDSAQAVTSATAGIGLRNKLSINPLPSTLYRVTVYAAATTTLSDLTIKYSRDGSTANVVSCADYNTQSIAASTAPFTFYKVTCYISTDATTATNPYVYFVQAAGTAHTFMIDTFSMTLSTSSTPNVQIGGGINGGPTTLFTVDKGASAPIAANNDAFLGSMYYDTTLGKLQCYEADGWGACGSSPDNIVTISPEYTNAVLHSPSGGTAGIGTMTSDICSDFLDINDATHGTPICGTNETYNFYRWTSPQSTQQTYAIYVTYQLPATFKSFNSGQTSLMARTDNGALGTSANVSYKIFRNSGTGLTQCGGATVASTGTVANWQTKYATGTADPSTCSFAANNSIVFEIDVTADRNGNAYVGNLNFAFSNK